METKTGAEQSGKQVTEDVRTGGGMSRRSLLQGMGSIAALGKFAYADYRSPSSGDSKRANIFVLLVDDVCKLDLGCYGNQLARTPRMDQLASEGMLFNNVYTTSPSCCPSRASFFTGLYPIRNGAHANWTEMKPDIKSMAHYLSALGYRTILLDKIGVTPFENLPFEYYGGYFMTPAGAAESWRKLEEILQNPGDKPYCIIKASFGTHFSWPHNKFNYDPAKVAFQPYLLDTPEGRKMRANYYSAITAMDEVTGQVLDLLKETDQEKNTLFIWCADHGAEWPRGKYHLYEPGINIPFIARWPGKIQPGSVSDALISYVDMVPTFIDIAGGKVSRVVAEAGGEPVDGSSFLPVLLGEKKEHHSEIFASHSWEVMHAYPHRAMRTPTHKYILNLDSQFTFPLSWAIQSPIGEFVLKYPIWKSWQELAKTDPVAQEWMRTTLYRPPEELYDLRADPFELKNLAADPAQAELLASMRAKLKAWMSQQGDAGDSAYHKDKENPWRKPFLEELYSRHKMVNVNARALGMGGWVNDTVEVELTCPIWRGTEIRYTLDGTEPTRRSTLYAEKFQIDPPRVVKAKAFFEEGETPVVVFRHDRVDYRFLYERTHYVPLIKVID